MSVPFSPLSTSMLLNKVAAQARQFEADLTYKNFNQEEAESAINHIYKLIGLPAPLTIWCENPMILTNLPSFCESVRLSGETEKERAETIKRIEKLTTSRGRRNRTATSHFWSRLRDLNDQKKMIPFGRALGSEVNTLILRNLASDLANAIDPVVPIDARQLIQEEVRAVMVGFLSRLKETWERAAEVRLLEDDLVRHNWTLAVDADLKVNASWGIWDLYWILGFFSINQLSSPQILEPDLSDTLTHLVNLVKNGSPYLLFENVCFAGHYPVVRSTDSANRWHNETGPALSFSDGLEFYFWHGSQIPELFIKHRRTINPITISMQPNATLRSIMMEIYGWEKYLRDAKAKIIDEDARGILYRLDFNGQEPLVAVSVLNSTAEPDGTFKRYTLRVPPTTKTVQEALAWTFHMRPKEYDPKIET